MTDRLQSRTRGFTLIELLIVIAIIGILIAAIAIAVTKAKEMAWQTTCGGNMKQVMEAMNTFHEHNGVYPPYNGVFPSLTTNSAPGGTNAKQVFGGWFTHLLPYTENQAVWDSIREECWNYGNTSYATIGGGTLITPATSGYWKDLSTGLAGTPPVAMKPDGTGPEPPTIPNTLYTGATTTTTGNGYSYTANSGVSPTVTNPNYRDTSGFQWVNGTSAVYGPPGAPYQGYIGVYRPETRRMIFKVLLCPSDVPADANAGGGLVYKGSSGTSTTPWSATNYLANWNAIADGNETLGWQASPGRRELVEDGPGTTIYLGEAYAWCEGKGRTALLAWHNIGVTTSGGVHNFGLTFNLSSVTFGSSTTSVTLTNGIPNPSNEPGRAMNFGFQIQPTPTKQGQGGCIALTVQTPHSSMNVVMGDSAVRKVRENITLDQWLRLCLPKDGQPAPSLD